MDEGSGETDDWASGVFAVCELMDFKEAQVEGHMYLSFQHGMNVCI